MQREQACLVECRQFVRRAEKAVGNGGELPELGQQRLVAGQFADQALAQAVAHVVVAAGKDAVAQQQPGHRLPLAALEQCRVDGRSQLEVFDLQLEHIPFPHRATVADGFLDSLQLHDLQRHHAGHQQQGERAQHGQQAVDLAAAKVHRTVAAAPTVR